MYRVFIATLFIHAFLNSVFIAPIAAMSAQHGAQTSVQQKTDRTYTITFFSLKPGSSLGTCSLSMQDNGTCVFSVQDQQIDNASGTFTASRSSFAADVSFTVNTPQRDVTYRYELTLNGWRLFEITVIGHASLEQHRSNTLIQTIPLLFYGSPEKQTPASREK